MILSLTTNPERIKSEYGKEVSYCYLVLNSSIVTNKYIRLAYSITDTLRITVREKRNQAIAKTVENAIKAMDERIEMEKGILYDEGTKKVRYCFIQENMIILPYLQDLIYQRIRKIELHELTRDTLEMIAKTLKNCNNGQSRMQNKNLEEAIKIAKEGLPY